MDKRKSRAFGKDIYLLGRDSDNDLVWLEHPRWDCKWYWGFGYVERYTSKDPTKAIDISSHTHIDTEFKTGDTINLNKGLSDTTYTKGDGSKLSILFTDFYLQRKRADEAHKKDETEYTYINNLVLPGIMNEIIQIIYPGAELITSPIKKVETNETVS